MAATNKKSGEYGGKVMSMIDMGFTGGPSMSADGQVCPEWMIGERIYNCENGTSIMNKAGSNLERIFQNVCKLFR